MYLSPERTRRCAPAQITLWSNLKIPLGRLRALAVFEGGARDGRKVEKISRKKRFEKDTDCHGFSPRKICFFAFWAGSDPLGIYRQFPPLGNIRDGVSLQSSVLGKRVCTF
jgi:hypothetical protein